MYLNIEHYIDDEYDQEKLLEAVNLLKYCENGLDRRIRLAREDEARKVKASLTKKVTDEITDKVTGEVTERVTREVTDKVTGEVTKKVTEEVTDKVTGEVTKKVTEEVTDKVTGEVTERVTREVTEDFACRLLIDGNDAEYVHKMTDLPISRINELKANIK